MSLSTEDLERLRALVGPDESATAPEVLAPLLTEWRGRYQGETPLLLRPKSTEAVRRVLAFCADRRVPLTVQGGNTGLVGGQIPQGEVLLSLQALNRIRDLDLEDDVVVAEAGVTLADLRSAAEAAGRRFPLSLASEGSCTVGGLVSTNAGGVAVLRYGVMRALVLGLEVVLPGGRIHHGLKRLRKDATGLDFSQVVVGAEGTLGVVTAASLKLHPRLDDRACAFVGVESPEKAVALLARAKVFTGGAVEAFEIISRSGVDLAVERLPGARDPLGSRHPYLVLIEIAYAAGEEAGPRLEAFLERSLGEDLVADAVIAANARQRDAFWALREGQSAAQKGEGKPWKHDVSTPVSRVAEFMRRASEIALALEPDGRIVAFGHVGDGNIHFDVMKPPGGADARHDALRDEAARRIHTLAVELGGSISAEHGLGVMKSQEAEGYKGDVELDAYRALRAVLDPHRILNPRVLF